MPFIGKFFLSGKFFVRGKEKTFQTSFLYLL